MTDVGLIQMPFGSTQWPSLGLSLLKAGLARDGIDGHVLYLNKIYADLLGRDMYELIARGLTQSHDLVGDWIFAEALWGHDGVNDTEYIRRILHGEDPAHRKTMSAEEEERYEETLVRAREIVAKFLDTCLTTIPWSTYRIIGFTSLFAQHVAALSLARRVKERYPDLFIIFGGSACAGPMGVATLQNFPFVDAVCLGEGDIAFPQLARAFLDSQMHPIEGILMRNVPWCDDGIRTVKNANLQVPNLDALPYPDFDEFFDTDMQSTSTQKTHMMLETSRGCWWGQKRHCTFCGLNQEDIAFRQKSADRALEEVKHLLTRYGNLTHSFIATDAIMPHSYFSTFLRRLTEEELNIRIFYETKANLMLHHVETLHNAGIRTIQPGVENLGTEVLRLMNKGVSGLQNIQMLKFCKQIGIDANWNYLMGLPGEPKESYERQSQLIPWLRHLKPPLAHGRVRFDRFSPYVERAADYGIRHLHAYPSYRFVYRGLEQSTVEALAVSFVGEFDNETAIATYTKAAREAIDTWREGADSWCLIAYEDRGRILILDGRQESTKVFVLEDIWMVILQATKTIVAIGKLKRAVADAGFDEIGEEDIWRVVRGLETRGLLVREGNSVLSLPVFLGSGYKPSEHVVKILEQQWSEAEIQAEVLSYRYIDASVKH